MATHLHTTQRTSACPRRRFRVAGPHWLAVSILCTAAAARASRSDTISYVQVVNQYTPGIVLSISSPRAMLGSELTLDVTVNGPMQPPQGQVEILDGLADVGTATLENGATAWTTSSLNAGSHSFTALYGGNQNFAKVSSIPVQVTVVDFTIAPGAGRGNQTIPFGELASFPLIIALNPSTSGASFPAVATLSVTGLPAGATASISAPEWVPGAAGSWTLAANTPVPATTLEIETSSNLTAGAGAQPWLAGLPLLCSTLLPIRLVAAKSRIRRRRIVAVGLSLALAACVMSLGGCIFSGNQPRAYALTVILNAGPQTHGANLSLTVQ